MSKKYDFKGALDDFKVSETHEHDFIEVHHSHYQTIRHALHLAPILDKIKDECESLMSNAEHRKKIASMDYHASEINHQDGRWHCANDIEKFITQLMKGVEDGQ